MRIVPNPDYTGPPRKLTANCHDQTPFITVRCTCGAEMHIHESQLDPSGLSAIATICKACDRPITFKQGQLEGAFAQMREEGWIE